MSDTSKVNATAGWFVGGLFALVFLGPWAINAVTADDGSSPVEQVEKSDYVPYTPPRTEWIYEDDAGYGAFPIGLLVEDEWWPECSGGTFPCWTYGTTEGKLYYSETEVRPFY